MASNLISVVDEDESVRRTTKRLIESFGYQAAVYESGEVLLRSRKLHETLCLIVDVQMPGIGGLELQRQLAAKGCSIPIIFITAYRNETSRQQAMQAGAVAFLDKPFSDEQLLKNIRSALKHQKKDTATG
jgi:FixJ family two-component response regulator